ncbi:imidazolonepropionase [Devosia sp. YIM 151766]|uniref:imidazolonepropionase n=1 Tax=Devosia sp. YIM 151766 TaxID=3017325 RepID=UPI00255C82CD|nr:imidazolonepropionase [Devosia sp. YIM 151766]WIY53882.1 imidazolonepropionase [Devosia sp. YIM 151766]
MTWHNARLITLDPQQPGLGIIENGALVTQGGRIVYSGPEADMPESSGETVDCGGRCITPALVDCHTHLVFGGDRAREFEMRLSGATYEDIARAGGGIVASVEATRALHVDGLVEAALPRLDHLLAEGVSTVEIKSGYGLDIETELRMLRAARTLAVRRPVRIRTSYLAAHAVPRAYRGRPDDYIGEIVLPGMDLAAAEGLVDAVDGFCETIAFSPAQIEPVFRHARSLGLPVKLHAEQLSNLGGAKLAAQHQALSADHLEYLDAEGARAMAEADTVAVLLPGAFYTLRETQAPPVDSLRQAGTRIAIATDCNPGTSPLTSMLLTMNMAATLFHLTVEECLAGATREAARALGLHHEIGTLEAGKAADFAIWNISQPSELVYRIGFNPLHARVFAGRCVAFTGKAG